MTPLTSWIDIVEREYRESKSLLATKLDRTLTCAVERWKQRPDQVTAAFRELDTKQPCTYCDETHTP